MSLVLVSGVAMPININNIEQANREYVAKLERKNKLVKNKNNILINCDSCLKPIGDNETYLSQTLIDKKHGNIEFAYCKNCIKEYLSDQEYQKLYSEPTLPDDPKELCKLCLKFYSDGHYDNDPDMQPLYELLKKLYTILNKENKQ